jgi:hypothetical protein
LTIIAGIFQGISINYRIFPESFLKDVLARDMGTSKKWFSAVFRV